MQKLTVDGVDYTRNYLTHGQLDERLLTVLHYGQCAQQTAWDREEDAPYSLLENA